MNLIIDTSTKYLYVCLFNDNTNNFVLREGNNDHSEKLMPEIEKLLSDNNLTVKDITKIISVNGPGSYTGCRIGVTVSKMFAYTNNIPLYSISSLKSMISGNTESQIASAIDARRNRVFSAIYEINDGVFAENLPEDTRQSCEFTDEAGLLADALYKDTYNPNPYIIEKNATFVDDVHNFQPNYLLATNATKLNENT